MRIARSNARKQDTQTPLVLRPGGGTHHLQRRVRSDEREAIASYDKILERAGAIEMAQSLQADLRRERILYGDRLICDFLRPNFITRQRLDFLCQAVEGVHQAMDAFAPRILADSSLQDFMELDEIERKVIQLDPGYSGFSLSGRVDGFLVGRQIRFVEYNGEAPLGNGYMDKMTEAFTRTSVMKAFAKRFRCRPLYGLDALLNTLIDTYESWGGKETPVIAILDYDGLKSKHEFTILQEHFSNRGYKTLIVDPRDLELKNDELITAGQKIDLVYRRVLLSDYLPNPQDVKPLYEACKAGTVCVVNPFRNKLFHNKFLFALLTDPDYHQGLTGQQIKAIKLHLPWTRKVIQGRTTAYNERTIDLLPYIRRNREQLVLKPNDEYGGKGVMMGWTMDDNAWEKSLDIALASPHLVQRRVEVARGVFPRYQGQDVTWDEYTVDMNPFLCGGRVSGAMARLSPSALCNICAGGGAVPTFVLGSC